jgi:hypothetical protein
MNYQHDNRNGFNTPEGKSLGKFDAPLVREVVHANDISVGILFNLWSRMPAATDFHPAPVATYYGAPVVSEAVTVQPDQRQAEVETMDEMFTAPSATQQEGYIEAISAQAQPETPPQTDLNLVDIRARIATEVEDA